MFRGKNPSPATVPHVAPGEDAVFIGWQKTSWGEIFPLYNVTAAGHPLFGSTVTEKTLLKLNLQTPGTKAIRGIKQARKRR